MTNETQTRHTHRSRATCTVCATPDEFAATVADAAADAYGDALRRANKPVAVRGDDDYGIDAKDERALRLELDDETALPKGAWFDGPL